MTQKAVRLNKDISVEDVVIKLGKNLIVLEFDVLGIMSHHALGLKSSRLARAEKQNWLQGAPAHNTLVVSRDGSVKILPRWKIVQLLSDQICFYTSLKLNTTSPSCKA